jgi:hypothetical protein
LKHISEHFLPALRDYAYLLERNYPQSSALKLVGDRYQLPGGERSMLMRGVTTAEETSRRKKKTLSQLPKGEIVVIDGFNVIRTLGSYLMGKLLFVSMDGFLRDASEMHRKTFPPEIRDRGLTLMVDFLAAAEPEKVVIYFDEPVSKSGELAAKCSRLLQEKGIKGDAVTVFAPDHHLKEIRSGVIVTADSAIIDQSNVAVFDLTRAILENTFDPGFIMIDKYAGLTR